MIISTRESRESAREYALRLIQENIIKLNLKPGTAVSENELAKELGISRTPIREALQELQKMNFIEVYPQKGSVISHIDFEIVEEMVFLRKVLEKAVVEDLCGRISEENLQELDRNVQLQEFYLDNHNPHKVYELDNQFHHLLFVYSNKERIYNMMEGTQGHFDRIRTLVVYSVKDIKIVEDHKAIVNAIRNNDRALAAEIIIKHLSRYKLDQKEIIKKYPDYFIKEKE